MVQVKTPSKKYAAVGRCIYCGSTDSPLTLEHIIPFGLGGQLELPAASCGKCQKIINDEIENPCLSQMFYKFRKRTNIPTRNPKKVPTTLTLEFGDTGGGPRTVAVPTANYPRMLLVPWFSPPTILEYGPGAGEPVSGIFGHFVPGDIDANRVHFRGRHVEFGKVNRQAFCRLLAKIGHGFAVAEIGPVRFGQYEPFLPDLILRSAGNWWEFIGGEGKTHTDPGWLHRIGHGLVRSRGYEYIVVGIHLFAGIGAPFHRVVVARRALPQDA